MPTTRKRSFHGIGAVDSGSPLSDPNDPKSLTTANKCITICATSARWLAESASRAGYVVNAVDLFGDWDLQRVARCHVPVRSLSEYLGSTKQISGEFLFGGGLESNLTGLKNLALLAGWKNSPLESLQRSRDPFLWSEYLSSINVAVADLKKDLPAGQKNRWLRKSFESTGGMGVEWCCDSCSQNADGVYFQEFVSGRSISSLHVNNGKRTTTLGVFVQLVGEPDRGKDLEDLQKNILQGRDNFSVPSFQFIGSIGPLSCSQRKRLHIDSIQMEQVAAAVAQVTQLRGCFGMDWIQDHQSRVIPVEVNPRLTASGELWEKSSGANLTAVHLDAIEGRELSAFACSGLFGKAIAFYSGEDRVITTKAHQNLVSFWEDGWAADIPNPGTSVQSGEPVVTVFSQAANPLEERAIAQVQQSLNMRVEKVLGEMRGAKKREAVPLPVD